MLMNIFLTYLWGFWGGEFFQLQLARCSKVCCRFANSPVVAIRCAFSPGSLYHVWIACFAWPGRIVKLWLFPVYARPDGLLWLGNRFLPDTFFERSF